MPPTKRDVLLLGPTGGGAFGGLGSTTQRSYMLPLMPILSPYSKNQIIASSSTAPSSPMPVVAKSLLLSSLCYVQSKPRPSVGALPIAYPIDASWAGDPQVAAPFRGLGTVANSGLWLCHLFSVTPPFQPEVSTTLTGAPSRVTPNSLLQGATVGPLWAKRICSNGGGRGGTEVPPPKGMSCLLGL
jgi:hypothetical protein